MADDGKYIFIDWSGDPGFKLRRGSSSHLVVVAIFTEDYDTIQKQLGDLRRERHVGQHFYFHHTDASKKLRPAFYAVLVGMPFTARIIVVDKAALLDSRRQAGGQQTIERFVAEAVIGAGRQLIEGAMLIFDGPRRDTQTIRGIRVAISRLIQKCGLDYRLKKVTARPAAEEDGLQVADMIAGMTLDEVTGSSHGYLPRLEERLEIIHVPGKENRPG